MNVEIVLWPNSVLTSGTKPVEKAELEANGAEFRDTVANMTSLMVSLRGVGLAAPQANISKRFLLICPSGEHGDERVLINPEIVSREGEDDMEEGCLSFPKVYGTIRRALKVKARYRDLDWNEVTVDLEGFPARILQHELDHLNGIVFIDRMPPADLARNKPRLDEMKKAAKALKA